MSVACCASELDDTTPVSRIESPAGLISRTAFGSARPEGLAQDVEVAADRDLERRDLATVGIHDEDRGGAVLDADQEELAGRAHDGVRDLRVGDEDLLGVPRQVDDERAADREVDAAGDRLLVRTDLEDRRRSDRPVRAGVAGERRRKERWREQSAGAMPATSKPILVFAVLRRVDPIRQPFLNSERLFTASATAWRRRSARPSARSRRDRSAARPGSGWRRRGCAGRARAGRSSARA